ncbi:helix-turn-helix domain-containing protein [Cohnella luojiensis]|uniref:AraC family transcriptional regulator n=1 Tax=Cohnella luojiensis TaxID=652876 RepID=A0A4Y8M4U9_9BACL|nr:AraC family transcriptional regulator [Cohnella luojiensis]TFE29497.1 AraC family transcriptional regulator [Cohnella luojiensis]
MTYFPDYLKSYPNMDSASPLHIGLHSIPHGFRPHRHDFLEFSYVMEGTGAESVNDVKHEMIPGTFTFVLPYQIHEIFTAPDSTLVLFNCMFSMDLLMETGQQEALISLIDRSGATPYVQFSGINRDEMRRLIENLHQEYLGNEPWKHTMLQIRLKEILVAFDRARGKERLPAFESSHPTGPSKRNASVWPIIYYIHRNYQEDITLSELATRYSMSLSRISEVIKETTGQNFLHFLHDLRIRHACSLLASTKMSVSEIALEVGYGSYQTFSRVFRESKGMVPKDYRKLRAEREFSG